MKLLKILEKYRWRVKIEKTELYQQVEKHKSSIENAGFNYTSKSVYSLFLWEVIYKSLENKKILDTKYDAFRNNNFDMFEYSNYDEKQKMFNHDLEPVLPTLVSFQDQSSKIEIYLPYVDAMINQKYIEDHEAIFLKHHQEFLNEKGKDVKKMFSYYGMQPFISKFSSLEVIGKDEENIYFYHAELKTVFIFDKEYNCFEEICIIDKYHEINPSLTEVKEIVKIILQVQDDGEVLEKMYEKGFISEKGYKKISKKLGLHKK